MAGNRLVLFCDSGESLTSLHLSRLSQHEVDTLYVRLSDAGMLDEYLSQELARIVENPRISTQEKAQVVYRCSLRAVTKVFDDPRAETISECRDVVGKMAHATLRHPGLDRVLLRITRHDRYTYDHSVNVGIFGTVLAKDWFGADSKLLSSLAGAYFLHDVGKCRIPLDVLNKPGPLDPEEREIIQQHPLLGFEILSETEHVNEETAIAVLQHHERADGSGYPHGLPEEAIHDFAKVVAIADVFDALTTDRPYRKALSTYRALAIIRDEMYREFPAGFFRQFVMLFADTR
jgi:HD-GYP domain-containing protein (c-di-GMP phosphodiesterase class II)